MVKKRVSKKRAKRPKKPQAKPEPYFIGIGDPVELRKQILEPTREVIQFLQSYEQFQKTKEEKAHVILQLQDDLKAIKTGVNKLKRLLPKSKLKTIKTKKPSTRKEIKEEKKFSPAKPKPVSVPPELVSLEKELGEIEKKLGTLSE